MKKKLYQFRKIANIRELQHNIVKLFFNVQRKEIEFVPAIFLCKLCLIKTHHIHMENFVLTKRGVTVNSVIKTKVTQIMMLDSRSDNLQIYTSVSTVQGKHLNKLCETTHYFELNTLIKIFP